MVHTNAMWDMSDTPAFLASGWTGAIDAVVVSSGLQSYYVMDDFSSRARAKCPSRARWLWC